MSKQYTLHVTDDGGNDYAIPGVTDCGFFVLPNGDPGIALKNPHGDDITVNVKRTSIRYVSRGYTPDGEPCYHTGGPEHPNGHTPEPWGESELTRGVEPDTHKVFQ